VTASTTYTYSWSLGSWSTCSLTCGGGTQTRSVTCQRDDGATVADTACTTPKPTTSQTCNTGACTTVPSTGWTGSFLTDRRIMTIPYPGIYPTKGVWLTDPVTGFRVTRAADKSELIGDYNNYRSPMSLIVYSRYTPVNTTGEFYVVHGDNSTSAWLYRTADHTMTTILRMKPSL
jgi:hypothetical protein